MKYLEPAPREARLGEGIALGAAELLRGCERGVEIKVQGTARVFAQHPEEEAPWGWLYLTFLLVMWKSMQAELLNTGAGEWREVIGRGSQRMENSRAGWQRLSKCIWREKQSHSTSQPEEGVWKAKP